MNGDSIANRFANGLPQHRGGRDWGWLSTLVAALEPLIITRRCNSGDARINLMKPQRPIAVPFRFASARAILLLLAIVAFVPAPYAMAADAGAFGGTRAIPRMPVYETKYYRVYTDVDPEEVKEACIRMTKMAEEYHNRTSDFAGQITQKLPFYLFKSAQEYYAAGGIPNSAGVFNGTRLMAIGDKRYGRQIWHIVQHEGFHQFVRAVIGGDIPIWVNEGMAEYFGEAIFTGDGFVSGVIPPGRLQRVRKTMQLSAQNGGFRPAGDMMALSHAQWNRELSLKNYDQAWSMVQFLAHGDNGKYQQAFGRYMGMVGSGQDPQEAWARNFGDDTQAFDARWRDYWKSLSASPTSDLYAQATVATLTSFLARAFDQQQRFASFDAFSQAAEAGTLRSSPDEWLPPTLLSATLRDLAVRRQNGEKFSFTSSAGNRPPEVICAGAEGLHVVGKFTLDEGHVDKVTTIVTSAKHS
jgi:hypothetical protein